MRNNSDGWEDVLHIPVRIHTLNKFTEQGIKVIRPKNKWVEWKFVSKYNIFMCIGVRVENRAEASSSFQYPVRPEEGEPRWLQIADVEKAPAAAAVPWG